jgi:chemotaxis protein CheX
VSGHPTELDLWEITAHVWASYLDPDGARPLRQDGGDMLNASEAALASPASAVAGAPSAFVSAAVSVTGAWDGDVVVTCSDPVARQVTATLLAVEPTEVTADDVIDAVAELVNIIGGNLKGRLPEPCVMSLPRVVSQAGSAGSEPSILLCRLSCTWLGEAIIVSVLERSGQPVEVRTA